MISMKILMFLIISITFFSCSPWPSNDDYVNTFSKNETIKELPFPHSLPTKEATMRLGGGMFVVNCHFLTRDDSFPIE